MKKHNVFSILIGSILMLGSAQATTPDLTPVDTDVKATPVANKSYIPLKKLLQDTATGHVYLNMENTAMPEKNERANRPRFIQGRYFSRF